MSYMLLGRLPHRSAARARRSFVHPHARVDHHSVALFRGLPRNLLLANIVEDHFGLTRESRPEAAPTRRNVAEHIALAQRDRRHRHGWQLALVWRFGIEHILRRPAHLATGKPIGRVITSIGAHGALRLIGQHPIRATECKPSAPSARTTGIHYEAVFGDL